MLMSVESVARNVNCVEKEPISITKILSEQWFLYVTIATKVYNNWKFRQRGKLWQSFAENAEQN